MVMSNLTGVLTAMTLTLLGGISRGLQYDFRSMASLQLHATDGIYSRDQLVTDYRRSQTSITRQGQCTFYYVLFIIFLLNLHNFSRSSTPDSRQKAYITTRNGKFQY